jgi:hypothetical protein
MSLARLYPHSIPTTLARIVLALAVLTSSLAWMPSAVQAAPQTESSNAPVVDAWISGPRLYVEATGFQRRQTFVLRARHDSGDKWIKLTTVKSNRLGIMNKSARLPRELSRADRLQVCLKDKKTRQQYCVRAWRSD